MTMVVLHTDFPRDAPDVREAADAIERLERRRADAVGCGAVLAAGAAAALLIAPELAAALLAGLVAAGVIAGGAHASLEELVDRCALFPTTASLPAAARRQRELVGPRSRRALAASLRGVAERGSDPHVAGRPVTLQLVLTQRVRGVRAELLELAALLEELDQPDPVAVARLRWLLRDGIASPLYDPTTPADELGVVLRHACMRLSLSQPDSGQGGSPSS